MTRADEIDVRLRKNAAVLLRLIDAGDLDLVGATAGCAAVFERAVNGVRAALDAPRGEESVVIPKSGETIEECPAWPAYGYCPTCGGMYAVHSAGLIRRHGTCPKKVACRYYVTESTPEDKP